MTVVFLVARTYGLNEVLNQSVAEREPLVPDTPGIVTYVVPSNEYSHLSGIPLPKPNVTEKLTEAFVTTLFVELQLVLMLDELACADVIPWNHEASKLINTIEMILFVFIMVLASHSRLP